MATRPSQPVALPAWMSIEREYEPDPSVTVDALVKLLTHPVTRRIAADHAARLTGEQRVRED